MRAFVYCLICATCWALFRLAFARSRCRYRNCYLLSLALASLIPVALSLSGRYMNRVAWIMAAVAGIALLIVPFFLIQNGIVMLKKEGRQASHMLSLGLGVIILIGEVATVASALAYSLTVDMRSVEALRRAPLFIAGCLVSMTVIYGSLSFLVFMIYVLFLQIVPKKKDFDYLIIHGAGLIRGRRISKLLRDRLDKAIDVYRRDPTPPKLIPSGGRGADEAISEAEAMRRYLLEKGVPDSDILVEDRSATTFENLKFSKQILDGREGRKYTALVTSNYHVYRALRYCRVIGLDCTGIGSHVALYYWPSALIREYIAIHAEKKHAVLFVAGWLACAAALLAWMLR